MMDCWIRIIVNRMQCESRRSTEICIFTATIAMYMALSIYIARTRQEQSQSSQRRKTGSPWAPASESTKVLLLLGIA